MMRSMFSGVSGLRAHQQQMDIIGNNISNVNTVGYKSSRVIFQEVYNQTLKSATGPSTGGRGGSNPQQVGLGVSIGSIDVLHTRSGAQRTDKATDLSIEGDGFFIVSDGESRFYTRAGNFDLDRLGNLTAPGGLHVLGWRSGMPTSSTPRPINLAGLNMTARQTESLDFRGNLNADMEIGDVENYTISLFDSLGREHRLEMTFEKEDTNIWTVSLNAPEGSNYQFSNADGDVVQSIPYCTLTFNSDGTIGDISFNPEEQGFEDFEEYAITFADGSADAIPILSEDSNDLFERVGMIDLGELTQTAGRTNLEGEQIGGYTAGVIDSISIGADGVITGLYTNGQSQDEWQIAMAHFTNPAGLIKLGDNLFQQSTNSGTANLGLAGDGGRGVLNPGSLEMSNVDLAQEFTDMIIAQRGFQANSRIITTSDELLQELVNLKR